MLKTSTYVLNTVYHSIRLDVFIVSVSTRAWRQRAVTFPRYFPRSVNARYSLVSVAYAAAASTVLPRCLTSKGENLRRAWRRAELCAVLRLCLVQPVPRAIRPHLRGVGRCGRCGLCAKQAVPGVHHQPT